MLTFQIYAPNLSESDLSPEAWTLPLYSTPEGCTRRGGDDTRGTPLGRALPSLNVKVSASPSSFQVSRRPDPVYSTLLQSQFEINQIKKKLDESKAKFNEINPKYKKLDADYQKLKINFPFDFFFFGKKYGNSKQTDKKRG